jgi:hypothetical protein
MCGKNTVQQDAETQHYSHILSPVVHVVVTLCKGKAIPVTGREGP